VAKVLSEGGDFNHGFTYSGHPVAAAVGLENLRILRDEKIVEKAKTEAAPYLHKLLHEVFGNHPLIGEIQGTGLLAALQFVEDKGTRKRFANENDLAWQCRTFGFEEGVIIRSTLGRMIMAPALVASRAELDELVDKTRIAVDRTARIAGKL